MPRLVLEEFTTNKRLLLSASCTLRTVISWNKSCQIWKQAIEDEEGYEDHLQGSR